MHIRNLGQNIEASQLPHEVSDRILCVDAGRQVRVPSFVDERIAELQRLAVLKLHPRLFK